MDEALLEAVLDAEIDPAFAARARACLEVACNHRPLRVLDAGSGRGFFMKALLQCPWIKHVEGIDADADNVTAARHLIGDDARANVQQGRLETLPFKPHSFDMILCMEVLEHVEDEDAVLGELRRVLSPGGTLFVSVPHRGFPLFWDPLNWCLMRLAGSHIPKDIHWLAGIWAGHERLYDEAGLRSCVGRHFEVEETRRLLRWCWPFTHFLLYGIGKNLVDRCGVTIGDRFRFTGENRLGKMIAAWMRAPSALDRMIPWPGEVQLLLRARRPPDVDPCEGGNR